MSKPPQHLFLVLAWVLVVVGRQPDGNSSCQGRRILTDAYGVIDDGADEVYPSETHCEWLIKGRPGSFINIHFSLMETECSYDYLFIYDGDSYSSPMLGSFSGDTLPDPIIAKSGSMLVYFFSDRNYIKSGFRANYSITECPFNCTYRGSCNRGVCDCEPQFKGEACEVHYSKCNRQQVEGARIDYEAKKCLCPEGYLGYQCQLNLNDSSTDEQWFTIAPRNQGLSGRFGHSLAYIPSWKSLCVFGGNTLNVVLNDLVCYHLNENEWLTVAKSSPWPAPRYDHAMVVFNNKLYVHGGRLADHNETDELWVYDIDESVWSFSNESSVLPSPRSSHTLTLVDNEWLYLFGGRTSNGHYLSDMYRINITQMPMQWEKVHVRGGRESSRSLVGHSTVYYSKTRSLLVFGGMRPDTARFGIRSQSLHTFHVDNRYWSEISFNPSYDSNVPKDRAFHSAEIMGDYLVIFGGNTHIHDGDEVCYDPSLHYYHLQCHQWINMSRFSGNSRRPRGRFSHASAVAFGNILFIFGGYRGNVIGDLVALKVPLVVARRQHDERNSPEICHFLRQQLDCNTDPLCYWCRRNPSNRCMHKSESCEVRTRNSCRGICGSLKTCKDCLIQASAAGLATQSGQQCVWCSKEARCQSASVQCNGSVGWWNRSEALTSSDQCLVEDVPAGLHLLKFYDPPDFLQPDMLEIVPSSSAKFKFESPFKQPSNGDYTVALRGFIHPSPDRNSSNLLFSMSWAKGWLNLSRSSSPLLEERVASIDGKDGHENEKVSPPWKGHLNLSRNSKFYAMAVAQQLVAGKSQQESQIMLRWSNSDDQPLSSQYLEPYGNGTCDVHTTCLSCMMDTLCGWCLMTSSCQRRSLPDHCLGDFLVTDSGECLVPKDLVSCKSCVETGVFEWLVSDAHCARAGQFPNAVNTTEKCPVPCRARETCTDCLSERNECAWCEETHTCFAFAEYVMGFNYGSCNWWTDWESKHACRNCSRHLNCSDCLQEHRCGWCASQDDPTKGGCMEGDFTDIGGTCVHSLSSSKQAQLQPAFWSYGLCPDVDECRLNYHECHENATCHNTNGSYLCTCNRGFKMAADGRTCEPSCYHECVYGQCSGAPDYVCKCDVGWTGDACDVNCGCNNHSGCPDGVGNCHNCLNNTMGKYCQLCAPGSYGNATTTGCEVCDCNAHGDKNLGLCNTTTGACYCVGNTVGANCQRCQDKYYGNPRNGGKCYRKCEHRTIMYNITDGAVGSHVGGGVTELGHAFCLWILSAFTEPLTAAHDVARAPSITFTVEPDFKTLWCSQDFLYVYDGIPEFLGQVDGVKNTLLGLFCGYNHTEPINVVAHSGILSVYFAGYIPKSNPGNWGFNASFQVNRCPDDCGERRRCVGGVCVCENGFGGIDCSVQLCPKNCSEEKGQGHCDELLLRCSCNKNFSGEACEVQSQSSLGIVTVLNDPHLTDTESAFTSNLSRSGHVMVTCGDNSSTLYVFGGYSLSRQALNDLMEYDIISGEWRLVQTGGTKKPSPRYLHSAVCIGSTIYVYGGLVKYGLASSQLWLLDLKNRTWSKRGARKVKPPAVAGHSLVVISDRQFLLIGGISQKDYFNQHSFVFDVVDKSWTRFDANGTQPIGLYGHSVVYRPQTSTVYVFGGYRYHVNGTGISQHLYALNVQQKWWSLLSPKPAVGPNKRYLHAAVGHRDYMVIIGGRTSDLDFDNSVHIYKYDCNHWLADPVQGVSLTRDLRPFILSAAVSHGDSIFVMGGFGRIMYGNLYKIKLQVVDTPCNTSTAVCSHFHSCGECLARWPSGIPNRPACHWCVNCTEGCVPKTRRCETQKITDVQGCMEQMCHFSDCEKCTASGHCAWTNQFRRDCDNVEVYRQPVLEWVCVSKNLISAIDKSASVKAVSVPQECPNRCYLNTSCSGCLGHAGGEGGAQKCVWSSTHNKCMPPDYLPLQCLHGECGQVITDGNASRCPVDCSSHKQCSACLRAPGCGWCYNETGNGEGKCMDGGVSRSSRCRLAQADANLGDQSHTAETKWFIRFPLWAFDKCPPEDECTNMHHTCNESESCTDLVDGFQCDCKSGYTRDNSSGSCMPVCEQDCGRNGKCVSPSTCQCDFGYVGNSCNYECQCNRNSNCPSRHLLHVCLECHNNTKGVSCENCKESYVGNPANGDKCRSCSVVCNNHSDLCYDHRNSSYPENIVCQHCANNTKGNQCEQCVEGFFRPSGSPPTDPCRPCECHGHSDYCDTQSGTNCDCHNNTKSPRCDENYDSKTPCYKQQCSKCVENFLGTPTQGHQCYLQMTEQREVCFDPTTQMDCNREPTPLRQGRTVFFAVQPKYLNVDIRIMLDVTRGGVDVFLTNLSDAFVVDVDRSTGIHHVRIDPKYLEKSSTRSRRSASVSDGEEAGLYVIEEYQATPFNSFIIVREPNVFLIVRNVKDRLIITLPNIVHDLTKDRFYIVLRGTGSDDHADTYGILFFRQDQLHIDLFVFFSVFFSCFFLFLAVCVLLWKSKQAFDNHRTRHQRRIEMEHMASRPFAKSLVLMNYSNDFELSEYPSIQRRSRPNSSGTKRLPKLASKYSLVTNNVPGHNPTDSNDRFNISPIALEPTEDGVAAVGTFILQLPGSSTAPVNACLGSALIQMRVNHTNPYHVAPKAGQRRLQMTTTT